jgi:glycogen debranching enzyme
MIAELLASYGTLPDIWGEGALFAFSGIDGETQSRTGFVLTFGPRPYALLIHTPARRVVDIRLVQPGTVRAATSDLLVVDTPNGALTLAFAAWHTLVGSLPSGAQVSLQFEDTPVPGEVGEYWVSDDAEHGDALVLLMRQGRFALAYGHTAEEAENRAESGLFRDLKRVVEERLDFYEKLPRLLFPAKDRLLKKCVSVMKVNTLSAEGEMNQHWSTPDRVPHQHMWLWDSVFHSIAMNYFNPRLSWNFLKSVLDFQRPDGMIPHRMQVDGRVSDISQPPILAWGVWENYQKLRDSSTLEYALPRLEQYLSWDLAQRDSNKNDLLEWFIEGDVRCRSGESGLDNSPRFDEAILLDAVDFSTFAALDLFALAQIAGALGKQDKAVHWQMLGEQMARQVHALLWDEAAGFYFDRRMDGTLSDVRAATGFFPLLLPDLPAGRAQRLTAALADPGDFDTAFPVPSVSAGHPAFSTDMWRGATWINLNYLIIHGLQQQGLKDQARELRSKTILFVDTYYRKSGVLFEFFDSTDRRPPQACERKGPRVEPYDIRRKIDSIRDYHWTAALTANLLLEEAGLS